MADPVRKKLEEELVEAALLEIQELGKKLKRGGRGIDSADLNRQIDALYKRMSSITKRGFGSDMHEHIQENIEAQRRAVEFNKRLAASLRQQTATRFPNIASLLTGGGAAGSIRGNIGRIQKSIERPFHAAFQFAKEKEKFDEMAAIPYGEEGGFKDEDTKETAEATLKGMADRIPKGFGGERMMKFAGKLGKFMDSPIIKAAGAGGMLGASILTAIIKKGIEASPMMQAMLKIMNTAIMLYLRPIGDFIGGMLRPIALFFMREVALPALRAGRGMIHMGEQMGKQLLGFLLKPGEVIQKAIMEAIHSVELPAWVRVAFPAVGFIKDLTKMLSGPQGEYWKKYDPMKDWASEQKLGSLAQEISDAAGFGHSPWTWQQIAEMINKDDIMGALVSQENTDLFKEFKEILLQKKDANYDVISDKLEEFDVATGAMIEFEDIMDEIEKKASPLLLHIELLKKAMKTGTLEFDNTTQAVKFLENALKDSALGLPKWWGEWLNWLEEGKVTLDDFEAAINWWITENEKHIQTWLEKLGVADKKVEEIINPNGPIEGMKKNWEEGLLITEGTMGTIKTIDESWITNNETTSKIVTTFGQIYDKLQNFLKDMGAAGQNVDSGYRYPGGWGGVVKPTVDSGGSGGGVTTPGWGISSDGAITTTINGVNFSSDNAWGSPITGGANNEIIISSSSSTKKKNKRKTWSGNTSTGLGGNTYAKGGWITEPIFGVGASGETYTMGEAGPELITPKGDVGGVVANIVINIDKVASDVDLEQIKPIVERALHEVHSRRGII